MKTAWFKGCKTKKDKESVTPAADYDSPSWAYKQADRNGFNRAVTTVLDLINLDKE